MTKKTEVIKKICLIGSERVGKTSLIKRFILNMFDDKYLKTLGTKVSKKVVIIEHPEKDLRINLTMLVWDMMGQETFRPLLQDSYFYGASGCLAVCDSTRIETLKGLDDWIKSLFSVADKVPVIILANKSDLKDNIQINEEELKNFSEKYEAPFFFTSAKVGDNVEKVFYMLGEMVTADIG
jgi:small GTP-binding protein